jgi:polyisoprenoid-binding protein YceI
MIAHRLRRLVAVPAVAVLLALAPAAGAQAKAATLDFNLDPATTAVHWTLNTTVHTVHGTFKLKNGAVSIDPSTGNASGLIVIDATSGESGDASRDSHMHKVVLESDRYPAITFRPTHVAGKVALDATGPITVDGVMNLHGQDHPLQLTVNLHPNSSGLASQTHFVIPYIAWGLKDPSFMMFRVEKQVAIDIDATAAPTQR